METSSFFYLIIYGIIPFFFYIMYMDRVVEVADDEIVVTVKDDDKSDKGFDYQPYVDMVLEADYDL